MTPSPCQVGIELQGKENKGLTKEATLLITIYGIFFTQFPKSTYVRVRRHEGKPLNSPRYYLDYCVDRSFQVEVDKNCKDMKGYGYTFPNWSSH